MVRVSGKWISSDGPTHRYARQERAKFRMRIRRLSILIGMYLNSILTGIPTIGKIEKKKPICMTVNFFPINLLANKGS